MPDERDKTEKTPGTGEEDLEVEDEAAEGVRGGDTSTTPRETISIPYTKPEYQYKG